MSSRDFVYWLQGYLEIAGAGGPLPPLTAPQVELIQRHLNLVFVHDIDPQAGPPEVQDKLNAVHDGSDKLQSQPEGKSPKPNYPPLHKHPLMQPPRPGLGDIVVRC